MSTARRSLMFASFMAVIESWCFGDWIVYSVANPPRSRESSSLCMQLEAHSLRLPDRLPSCAADPATFSVQKSHIFLDYNHSSSSDLSILSARDMEEFIDDALLRNLNITSTALTSFILANAQSADNLKALKKSLLEAGVDDAKFAEDLWHKLGRRQEPKVVKRNPISVDEKKYGFVDDPPRKKIRREGRARKKESGGWSDEEEEPKRRRLSTEPQEPPIESKVVEERLDPAYNSEEDRDERDAFAERLRQRDKNRDHIAKSRPEIATADIGSLRNKSRQVYLAQRSTQQLALLRQQVQDDEEFFRNVKMTKRERAEVEYNKEVLRLAEERANIDDGENGYTMPEDYITESGRIDRRKKEAALYARYKPDEKETPEVWDRNFAPKIKEKEKAEEYEYVFDDSQHLNFIADNPRSRDDELLERIKETEKKYQTLQQTRESLPVFAYRKELLEAMEEHQILIVVGETGSGKTTQLPQYIHEAGYTKRGKVGCTQPRRVAAMSVAARVAEEMGVKLGSEVGYAIRFEDNSSEKTVLKYMTDGMLLREFLVDPSLDGYSCIMIDEAHERTLHTDILFGLIKDISRFRSDLKILISSATLNATKFAEFFDDAPIFSIPGRMYDVDVHYTAQPEANYLHASITTIFQIHTTQGPGDILVFLTGQDEIESCAENILETSRKLGSKVPELIVAPIFANLPSELQARIFEPTPPGARKVVLATNIAETSITIDGIAFVIDPGFVKENVYNPRTGMESLVITPCSRAAAEQRKGRAGRVGPGKCFRLYTKWAYFHELEESTTPEIQRTNLSSVVLMLKSLGINDLMDFDFMDAPPVETLVRAMELLYSLGALNDKSELTKTGRQMAEFPTDPMLAKAILASDRYECVEEVLTIISMLGESSSLFFRPKDKKVHADAARAQFTRPGGDHLTLLNIYNQWVDTDYSSMWARENFLQPRALSRARDVREQLLRLCDRVEVDVRPGSGDTTSIQKALASGFFPNTARLQRNGQSYRTVKRGNSVYIHPSSVLYESLERWVIYYELVLTSKEYMRNCMPLRPEWLTEVSPHYFQREEIDKNV